MQGTNEIFDNSHCFLDPEARFSKIVQQIAGKLTMICVPSICRQFESVVHLRDFPKEKTANKIVAGKSANGKSFQTTCRLCTENQVLFVWHNLKSCERKQDFGIGFMFFLLYLHYYSEFSLSYKCTKCFYLKKKNMSINNFNIILRKMDVQTLLRLRRRRRMVNAQNPRRHRYKNVFQRIDPLEEFDDFMFKQHFRFNKQNFRRILHLIEHNFQ